MLQIMRHACHCSTMKQILKSSKFQPGQVLDLLYSTSKRLPVEGSFEIDKSLKLTERVPDKCNSKWKQADNIVLVLQSEHSIFDPILENSNS